MEQCERFVQFHRKALLRCKFPDTILKAMYFRILVVVPGRARMASDSCSITVLEDGRKLYGDPSNFCSYSCADGHELGAQKVLVCYIICTSISTKIMILGVYHRSQLQRYDHTGRIVSTTDIFGHGQVRPLTPSNS